MGDQTQIERDAPDQSQPRGQVGAMPAPVPGTVPVTSVQDNGLRTQVGSTTVELNGVTINKCMRGGGYFVDSGGTRDAVVISVPDTSSDDETVSEEEATTLSPLMDDAKETQMCAEEDVLMPGTPEPSSGRRRRRYQISTGKPSKLNFSNDSASELREDSSLRGVDMDDTFPPPPRLISSQTMMTGVRWAWVTGR